MVISIFESIFGYFSRSSLFWVTLRFYGILNTLSFKNFMEPLVHSNHLSLIKKGFFYIFPVLILLLTGLGLYLHFSYPTTSFLVSGQYMLSNLGHSHAQMQKDVIGFLPYWNLDNSKNLHFYLFSEVFFFSFFSD